MRSYSPLRYPGGKGKLSNYFKEVFKKNFPNGGIYVEPYAGGASIALNLLIEGYASKIIINDIDRSIFSFWYSVLNYTEELCEMIEKTPITIEVWEEQKNIQKNKNDYGLLTLGFATFFLNRTNRSGILKAGVIGGKKQTGNWKIDARYNKKELIEKIQMIASYKERIEVHNLDTLHLIRLLKERLKGDVLFYLDPPYYEKGKELYLNYYTDQDHEELSVEVKKLKGYKWIITYDCADLIKELYKKFRMEEYSLTYSVGKARKGTELMIFSKNINTSKPILPISKTI